MLNTGFFHPRNLALIAGVVLVWAFLFSKVKVALDTRASTATA